MAGEEELEIEAVNGVISQVEAGEAEVEVNKADWLSFGLHLQEAVNFATYDLLEPPERGRRGKVILARKRTRR